MRAFAVAGTAIAALVLTGALGSCGSERPNGPPDAVFTQLVADQADRTPVGEAVDLVFEVLDEAPVESSFPTAWKPPYRVMSQLVVCAHLNQEFFAEGSWRNQQITVEGVVRPMDEKTGVFSVIFSCGITTLSGPLRNRSRMRTAIHLKPNMPTQLNAVRMWTDERPNAHAVVMWLRPHVTPGQPAPFSPQP